MRKFIVAVPMMLGLVISVRAASSDGLTPIEPDMAKAFGKRLSEEAAKLEKPQIKIEADSEKANGVHAPDKMGIIVVPQKDLKESEELAAKFKTEKGASLAYLFMYHVVPVIDGKAVDVSQLRSLKIEGDNGKVHTVYVMLLAVKQVSDDDYRLHAYGQGDKPLVDVKFSEGTGPGAEPVACEIKDPNEATQQGKLAVTVFGKYQASFTCAYKAD